MNWQGKTVTETFTEERVVNDDGEVVTTDHRPPVTDAADEPATVRRHFFPLIAV